MLLVLFHLLTLMPGNNDLEFQITAAKKVKKLFILINYFQIGLALEFHLFMYMYYRI